MRPAALAFACLIAVAACGSDGDTPPPVAAPDLTQDYRQETETEEYSAHILIPAAARAAPGLGDRLVASADAEIADTARRAAERRRERPSGFAPSQLLVTWTVEYEDAGALSLLGLTRVYEGEIRVTDTRGSALYDRAAGRELSFGDLFTDPRANGAGMTAVSQAAFATWTEVSPTVDGRNLDFVDERIVMSAEDGLRARASSFPTFVLVPADDRSKIAGVNLLYPEGALGPVEDGPFTLFVSAEVLRSHLKPEWAARLAPAAEPAAAGEDSGQTLNSAP